jgi:hypothetical protein
MGKTHRKNQIACPNSVSYRSDHSRGFARKKKAYSHHQIRTENRDIANNGELSSCEYAYAKMNCKIKKLNHSSWSDYCGKPCNIPNGVNFNLDDDLHHNPDRTSHWRAFYSEKKEQLPSSKWKKEDGTPEEELSRNIMAIKDKLDMPRPKKDPLNDFIKTDIDVDASLLTYYVATEKQLKRRGEIGRFYTHRDNCFEDDTMIG